MYYYEGDVEITSSSVYISFRGRDIEARKLVLTLNITGFPPRLERKYKAGLAFMLLTSDSPFDTRFFLVGLASDQLKYKPSISDEQIAPLLKLPTNGYDVWLTTKMDRAWYEMAIAQEA